VPQAAPLTIETEINYTQDIFPLSLSGGSTGLVFSQLPHVLPAGSFQIEGGLLLGSFYGERFLESLPFEIGFRLTAFSGFEVSAVFNAKAQIEQDAGWGITGSVKYNFFNGVEGLPLAFSAAVSYSWADENGEDPLSSGRGVGLYFPVSLEYKNFIISISPAVFWHGPESPAPLLLLSTGVLYLGNWYNAGISFRSQLNFEDNKKSRYLAGVQAHFYPPPSNLVFSFQAGVCAQDSYIGGYGGLGIGFIF
jgi:hypothetical protein